MESERARKVVRGWQRGQGGCGRGCGVATDAASADDDTSFAARLGHQDPVREVTRIQILRTSAGVRLDIHGTGFLRYMVRNVVGLLAEIGAGLHPPNHAAQVLAARDRTAAGVMAPARGLLLLRIETERDWFGDG